MSMDANFGLVRKHNSGTSPRPLSLVDSYFIDSSDVDSFVNSYGSDSKKDKVSWRCNKLIVTFYMIAAMLITVNKRQEVLKFFKFDLFSKLPHS